MISFTGLPCQLLARAIRIYRMFFSPRSPLMLNLQQQRNLFQDFQAKICLFFSLYLSHFIEEN